MIGDVEKHQALLPRHLSDPVSGGFGLALELPIGRGIEAAQQALDVLTETLERAIEPDGPMLHRYLGIHSPHDSAVALRIAASSIIRFSSRFGVKFARTRS